MTSYTNIFGGSPVQPSEVGYRSINTAIDVTLSWPTSFLDNTNVAARIMDVNTTAANIVITMPAANEVATGQDVLFRNVGANAFTVNDNDGNLIITVNPNAPNNTQYIYITDNSTSAGTWGSVQFGAGTSQADANALAGLGLTPLNSLLNTNFPGKTISANYQVLVSDRASLIVWTGGSGTITLPSTAATPPGFYIAINNNGSGSVTLTTPDAKTIDGSATKTIDPGDSTYAIEVEDSLLNLNWNTLGLGKDTLFAANSIAIDVSIAATVNLSAQQASNLIIRFHGVLTQNTTVTFPAAAGQWYIWNDTTGAFTLTVKLFGIGAGILSPQGEKLIVYSDSLELYNTPTISTSTVFPDGNVGAPGIAFTSQNTTGFFRSASGTTGYSSAGTQTLTFGTYGLGIVTGGEERYYNIGNTNYVGFKSGVLAGNTIWTLPTADATSAGQVWKSDAAGNLSFTTATFPNVTTINQILYSSATNVISGLPTANSGVLITSAGGIPSISSTIPNATQDNITRLGTITTGVWNGTVLTVPFGGTGLATLTTAYGVVCAGTTATGVLQNAGAGTAGQFLISNGAAALPTWQNLSGTLTAASKAEQQAGVSLTTYVTPGRQQFHFSASKVWTCFSWIGGVPTSRLSYNVASFTDTAVGITRINFTTAFSGIYYGNSGLSGKGLTITNLYQSIGPFNIPPTASLFEYGAALDGALSDAPYAGFTAFGDQ